MKVLVFEIYGDYAHFRKPFSTTSSLTYNVPPRTAVMGIVGAIMGVESGGFGKSLHVSKLEKQNLKTAVKVITPIENDRFSMNYSYTKSDAANKNILHIQVPVEVVKNPRYRIYVSMDDNKKFREMLEKKETYFTPCLGITEFIANIEYIGEFDAKKLCDSDSETDAINVDSIIYMDYDFELTFSDNEKIFRETHALSMNASRNVTEYCEIAYEANGKGLNLKSEKEIPNLYEFKIQNKMERVILR